MYSWHNAAAITARCASPNGADEKRQVTDSRLMRRRPSVPVVDKPKLAMEAGESYLKREDTPSTSITIASIPQKRVLEDDHLPTVSSPLNPDFRPAKAQEEPSLAPRAARVKKESLKKREAKAGDSSARVSPDPKLVSATKNKKKENNTELAPIRYKIAVPTAGDFKPPQAPGFIPVEEKIAPDGSVIQFCETTDHVFNKKAFHYTSCVPDPAFPHSLWYRNSDNEPYNARFSLEDSAAAIFMDKTGKHMTTEKGWRSARANVGMREGRWFWEFKVTCGIPHQRPDTDKDGPQPHVRMGIARREATLDGPVGFDCYSYGVRDIGGQKMHMSRPKDFFPPGEDIKEGDVIGFELHLPSETLHRKVVDGTYNPKIDAKDIGKVGIERADIIRDRVSIMIKNYHVFEQIAYAPTKELEEWFSPAPTAFKHDVQPCPTHPTVALRTLPLSSLKVYKNGRCMGTAFENLFAFLPPASKPVTMKELVYRDDLDDGTQGYYPTVAVFSGGAVEANFGPNFDFPPPGYDEINDEVCMIGSDQPVKVKEQPIRPLTERYDEQIVEDIVADLVDEVHFWMVDGGATGEDPTNLLIRAGIVQPTANGTSNTRIGSGNKEED